MEREVRPELLDELPPDDPRAIRSRGDLRRVNAWMGNARAIASLLQLHCRGARRRIVDLGGGDGALMLEVARRLPHDWKRAELRIVDQQNILTETSKGDFASRGWNAMPIQKDVFDWAADSSQEDADAMVANLFLHHFEAAELRELFQRVARRTSLFIACDPRRFRANGFVRGMLWLIGCNDVTRHDGEMSVRAGFRNSELSKLWPGDKDWLLEERDVGLFRHLFVARRVA
jgi:hypothetical protein